MTFRKLTLTAALVLSGTAIAQAQGVNVTMNAIDASGVGKAIGALTLSDSKDGLRIEPKLESLPAGDHGFHVHVNPDCGPAAAADGKMAAGLSAGRPSCHQLLLPVGLCTLRVITGGKTFRASALRRPLLSVFISAPMALPAAGVNGVHRHIGALRLSNRGPRQYSAGGGHVNLRNVMAILPWSSGTRYVASKT